MKRCLPGLAWAVRAAVLIVCLIAANASAKRKTLSPVAAVTVRVLPPSYASADLLRKLRTKAIADPRAAPLHAYSLSGSDWYGIMMANIAGKNYYTATGSNPDQAMNTGYDAEFGRASSPLAGTCNDDSSKLSYITQGILEAYLPGAVVSGGQAGSFGQPLPIRLVSFNAATAGSSNRTDWQTATEGANTRFEVERSRDALAFTRIGKIVASAGGGNGSYTFYDSMPLIPIAYYRVKAIEVDSNVIYSNVIAVRRSNGGKGVVTISPIPATGIVTITSTDASLDGTDVGVLDMQGRSVFRFSMSAVQSIDLSTWPAGVYNLRLVTGEVRRFVKE